VIRRVLSPFPAALDAFQREMNRKKGDEIIPVKNRTYITEN
jgi:hypothetical protein